MTTGKLRHYLPQNGLYVYFRFAEKNTVMVVLNKSPKDTELDLTRFRGMLKEEATGRNVLTEERVDLRAPLKLRAMKSVAIEF